MGTVKDQGATRELQVSLSPTY